MTISQALNCVKKELSQKGFRGGLESEILLSFVLQKERVFLHTHTHLELSHEEETRFFELVTKRLNDYPIEYLLESCSFYGRDFYVNEHVLIPRPETELLVEKALAVISQYHLKDIGEIGIGSGCVSVSLALENPKLSIVASDISKSALEVASKNIERFNLKKRIFLKETHLWDHMPATIQMLVSNPPYIARDYPLEKSVLKEPHNALFGGVKGDEILKEIVFLAAQLNIPFLVCEMGYDQQMSLKECLEFCGYHAEFYKDLSGLDRGFVGVLKSFLKSN
ncbi:peptide chain release factor N(5)-glutamine methyltransferase [Helicobacter cetorum]|uniref:peptide chain release factor N(5)-glutamine methyltransferase n=1 Tax=Helicobacter cetorum (strain ATCC BAA-540 / CCUG 52418 / MIT 99-5656) TaxID=1163745 RepID=I0EUL3_HELCM|nr:peptide chain release factor N(5)-glutamine methyltransferase [Helicobacter cetorum]AFI06632.1 N5-glutamine S-adenosyl-L-methionine-dependent methyltransferase [Helicobacter cetorum MIT 99-5656]